MHSYDCPVCGYVYDADQASEHGAFEALSGDWRCPVCACDKQKFTEHVDVKNDAPLGDESCYICLVCGYRYETAKGDPAHDAPAGTAFADIPKDWTCPKCRAPKSRFAKEG